MASVWSSAQLLEFDFAGIEARLLGWMMKDAAYMRLAKLGIHAYVASHVLKRPAELTWEDARLADYFRAIKEAKDAPTKLAYNQCKRTVHGKGYGMTVHGLLRNNPQYFRSLADAQKIDDVYCACAPSLPKFHQAVQWTANEKHYLGGPGTYTYDADKRLITGHPYGYKHWFHSVVAYQRVTESQKLWRQKRKAPLVEINGICYAPTLGEDAKRAIAFYPQSTARGVLTEACFPLFDREDPWSDRCDISTVYYGATPLRAPIHDSLLLEVPTRLVDHVIERVAIAMQRPVAALPCDPAWGEGDYLMIGVDGKIGPDWGLMEKVKLPSWAEVGVSGDVPATPAEEADEEELLDLEVEMGGAA